MINRKWSYFSSAWTLDWLPANTLHIQTEHCRAANSSVLRQDCVNIDNLLEFPVRQCIQNLFFCQNFNFYSCTVIFPWSEGEIKNIYIYTLLWSKMTPVWEPRSDSEHISTGFGTLFFLQSGGRPYDFLWNLKLLPLFPWQFCYSEMLCKASKRSLGWKLSGTQWKPSQSQSSMEVLGPAPGLTGLEGDPWRLWQESCSKQRCFLTAWKYCVGCWLPVRAGRFLGMLKWFTSSAVLAQDQAMLHTPLLMEGQNLTSTAYTEETSPQYLRDAL